MNIFVPFISLLENAKSLWKDKRRFNKQIIECNQIIKAIEGNKAWRNHPITKMYELNKNWVELYRDCLVNYRLFINSTNHNDKQNYSHLLILINRKAKSITPSFLKKKSIVFNIEKDYLLKILQHLRNLNVMELVMKIGI